MHWIFLKDFVSVIFFPGWEAKGEEEYAIKNIMALRMVARVELYHCLKTEKN